MNMNNVEVLFTDNLSAVYDSAQSFYHKARVLHLCNGGFILRSYDTDVAYYDSETKTFYLGSKWDYSPTTLRHVKEFIYQHVYRFLGLTKKNIEKMLTPNSNGNGFAYRLNLK